MKLQIPATSSALAIIERERVTLSQIAQGMSLSAVLEGLLLGIEQQSEQSMRTSVLILSDDGKQLLHGAAPSLPLAYNQAIDGMMIGEGQGSCGTVAHRGTPVYVDDIATNVLWKDFRELALSHELRACWSTPIHGIQGGLLGTFAIYYDSPRAPTQLDIDSIAFITQTAALAIERHRTEQRLRRSQDKLHALNVERTSVEALLRGSEAKVREQDSYWRGLFERLNEGFMVIEIVRDALGVARTWKFLDINDAWERISGLSQATARGRNVDDVIPGLEQEWLDAYIKVAETGMPFSGRIALGVLNQIYNVRASRIAPDRVAVLFEEISDQHREEVRRTALLALHDRTRDLDGPLDIASAACEIMGTALRADRAGYGVVSSDDRTVLVDRDWCAKDFPSAVGRYAIEDYGDALEHLPNGETIAIADVLSDPRTCTKLSGFEAASTRALIHVPIIEGGKFVACFFVNSRAPRQWDVDVIAFARNVAGLARSTMGRRRAEAELRTLADSLEHQVEARTLELTDTQAALFQSQKMEAVGQLTGGLAHDFNNLLMAVMGNLELIQSRVARGRLEELDRFVNAAQGAGRRASALTQRLLAFSRRQTLDPKPTDVNRLIASLEDLLRRTVGATVDIEVVGAGGLWVVDVDAGQLENSILNLCINGRDAMPNGGKIILETANKWIDDRASKDLDLPAGQYISVCVTDNGMGMPPEVVKRAFEPFFTTKPIGMGTGLGLSMIYGFARQSGGHVRIYSEVGRGSTICIYLPRYHGAAASEPADEQRIAQAGGHGQTVLVVDDESAIRHLIDEVLDEMGYSVIGAPDGAAALKVLQSTARVDLLITDVGLPNGMNGRQVADAARELRPGMKVLFITGFAENAAIGNGHLEPGMALLTKPFTLESLSSKVSEMLPA